MVKPTVAALSPPERVLKAIQDNPGIHFRGLMREAGITSPGHLQFCIDGLVAKGNLTSTKDGRFTRFFINGQATPNNLTLLRPVPNRIANLLKDGPRGRTDLQDALKISQTALGYHLTRLKQAGLIESADGKWRLSNPQQTIPTAGWDE